MARRKIFGFIPPAPGIDIQEFHDHYRHPHGTFGLRITSIQNYVQSHRFDSGLVPREDETFGAVAEIWMDNEDDIAGFADDPVQKECILPDEKYFIDMDHLVILVTEEDVVVSGPKPSSSGHGGADATWTPAQRPTSIKIMQLFADDAAFDDASRDDVGQITQLGALRYVRCRSIKHHRAHAPGRAAGEDAIADRYVAVRELWWPTLWDMKTNLLREPDLATSLFDRSGTVNLVVQAERFK